MDLYDVFNQQLKDFIADVSAVYPDIKGMTPVINLAMGLEKTTPATMFSRMVAHKFGDRIAKKDESFFLEYSFSDEVSSSAGVLPGLGLDIVGQLKNVYQTLQPSNKEAVWKHLQVLVLLCKRIDATVSRQ